MLARRASSTRPRTMSQRRIIDEYVGIKRSTNGSLIRLRLTLVSIDSLQPRIVAVKPSGSGFRPSPNSAFRPIVKEVVAPVVEVAADDVIEDFMTPPPRPPKSTRVKQRVRRYVIFDLRDCSLISVSSRLHNDSICPISGHHRGSPPPLPPRRFTEADKLSTGFEL